MRFIGLLLTLLATAAQAVTPVVVQTSSRGDFPQGGAGATATITFTGITAGNSIIVAGLGGEILPGGGATMSCNDGSAFTSAAHVQVSVGGNVYVFSTVQHRHNVASGTHVIVCTNSAGTFASYGYVCAIEVSGLQNAAADVTSTNSGTSNSPTTGSATPSTASSIAVATGMFADFGNPVAFGHPPSGYTSICVVTDGTASGGGSGDYKILSSTSAENPSYATFTAANQWTGALAVYKATTGSALLLRRQRQ